MLGWEDGLGQKLRKRRQNMNQILEIVHLLYVKQHPQLQFHINNHPVLVWLRQWSFWPCSHSSTNKCEGRYRYKDFETIISSLPHTQVILVEKEKKQTKHPGKLTWNPKMEVWKIILLFNWMIFRFHVNFQRCKKKNSKLSPKKSFS